VVDIVELAVSVQFECLPVDFPHVAGQQQTIDVALQGSQLVVVATLVVRQNRDGVVELKCIAVCRVVDENQLGRVAVDHSQIFYVYPLGGHVAVLSEQSVVHQLALGV
jgi:hypothetical protein